MSNTLGVVRQTLLFPVDRADIRRAIDRKIAHHNTRLAHWRREVEARDAKLRAEGVTVDTDDRTTSMTSGYHSDVSVDQKLVAAVREAQNKVSEHRNLVQSYSQWAATFDREPSEPLQLTHEDLVFFGVSDGNAYDNPF